MTTAVDPFLALKKNRSEVATVEQPKPAPSTSGRIVYYDLETVPDESRLEIPAYPDYEESLYAPDIAPMTLEKIKKLVPKMGDVALRDLESLEMQKEKPRKGLLTEIEVEQKRRARAHEDWVKTHSVSPLTCRIVAAGWAVDDGEPQAMYANDDEGERELLEQLWAVFAATRQRCGYNILNFDDTTLGIRSLVLGVDPIGKLDRNRYRNNQAIDLMHLVSPGKSFACKDVAKGLGIDIPAGDFDGSQVYDAWVAEERDKILTYVKSDVVIEREIHKRLQRVFA